MSRRPFAFVTLLFQLMLAGVGPIVDARLEIEAHDARTTSRFVDEGSSQRTASHEHYNCLVCRALQSLDTPRGNDTYLRVGNLVLDSAPTWATQEYRPAPSIRSHGPRAPPV